MASVASASPSGQGFLRADTAEDTESWQYVETTSSPAGYLPSPSSSYNGWGIIGYPNHLGASPAAMSPLPLDHDNQLGYPAPTSYPNPQSTANTMTAGDRPMLSFLDNQQFGANHELLFPDLLDSTFAILPEKSSISKS
jgi:hypothetical protein